jgi:potassium-transporting ATPase KdpC subunit
VARVASGRGLAESEVRDPVESKIQARDLGYLGEPTVNVLQLNLALAELE